MLNDIYNKRIIELAGNIPRLGRLPDPHATATAHSRAPVGAAANVASLAAAAVKASSACAGAAAPSEWFRLPENSAA